MARQPKRRSIRNLKSTGWQAARITGNTLGKIATGLFHWLTTDRSGRVVTALYGDISDTK